MSLAVQPTWPRLSARSYAQRQAHWQGHTFIAYMLKAGPLARSGLLPPPGRAHGCNQGCVYRAGHVANGEVWHGKAWAGELAVAAAAAVASPAAAATGVVLLTVLTARRGGGVDEARNLMLDQRIHLCLQLAVFHAGPAGGKSCCPRQAFPNGMSIHSPAELSK
eukprot:1153109-Pelagomonas_calceolata.AAC.8